MKGSEAVLSSARRVSASAGCGLHQFAAPLPPQAPTHRLHQDRERTTTARKAGSTRTALLNLLEEGASSQLHRHASRRHCPGALSAPTVDPPRNPHPHHTFNPPQFQRRCLPACAPPPRPRGCRQVGTRTPAQPMPCTPWPCASSVAQAPSLLHVLVVDAARSCGVVCPRATGACAGCRRVPLRVCASVTAEKASLDIAKVGCSPGDSPCAAAGLVRPQAASTPFGTGPKGWATGKQRLQGALLCPGLGALHVLLA